MAEIQRATLFGKMSEVGYKSMESATVFCKLRGNPYVEFAHWIHQVLQLQDSDLHRLLKYFEIDPGRLATDLTRHLDRLPRGASSITDLSSQLEETVERGWVYASLMFGTTGVRVGHVILGALMTDHLRHSLHAISAEFKKISPEALGDNFDQATAGSPEENAGAMAGGGAAPGDNSGAIAPASMGKQEALQRYTHDITAQAASGEMDPIVGRDDEIRQIVDILMRRRQNNPILTGEAGVGKTAVVEGFAQRIASGDVPPPLRGVRLLTLDVGLLQAGASMKGEFENRLKQVVEEVQSSEQPIILFVDEAHTLFSTSTAGSGNDAANLLKPALARGTLRTVAATTHAEYKKHIEKDPALTRRFQVVQIDEPSEDKCLLMIRGMASAMEKHHQVQVLDEALENAVRLSHRYIPARQLPDKAISLLDTACARVAISQSTAPAEVEDSRRRIDSLETELAIIAREKAVGIEVADREQVAEKSVTEEKERLATLEARWGEEKEWVQQILAARARLRGDAQAVEGTGSELEQEASGQEQMAAAQREELLQELQGLQTKLAALQESSPLILPCVEAQAIASVVADWTGIPVGRMVQSEIEAVLNLSTSLSERVIGQDHGLEMIARRIQTSRANLENPNKPIGVFMLAGPSGVGKTESALALAETLYGGEHNMITINMSEFQEAHTVSTLKGAPPGYVGYGEGGILTEAVRRKPYSVVLLDEVEKAHPDVHEVFFQVFDKGIMEDGEGRVINFKNTLIILTSNVGSDLIMNLCKDPDLMPTPEGVAEALRKPLLEHFPAALLGRIVTIPYYPLSDKMVATITRLQLKRIEQRIADNYKVAFVVEEPAIDLIVKRCTELESGGRMIDAILTNTMLPQISREILTRTMNGQALGEIRVGVEGDNFCYSFGGGEA